MSYKHRKDTISKQKEDRAIDTDRQQIAFCLAVRGEGKSNLIEAEVEKQHRAGYTVLDLHAPPNMENGFWCIPRFGEYDKEGLIIKETFERDMREFKDNPVKFMKTHQSYPITILCSESLEFLQSGYDRFNDRIYTEKEWYEDNPDKIFNCVDPPLKPRNRWGKQMIKFVKLPNLKKNFESEEALKAIQILTDVILEARERRRIVVLNRQMFGSENQYFWCMELIMRSLPDICDQHFIKLFPHDVGVQTEKQMTSLQKKHHRLTVIHRELADLSPAKLKADKGGESTTVKKALLGFARICRHWEIDWFADWQHHNSVEGAIRDQCDTWLFKKYNKGLAGEEKKILFDKVNGIRKAILKRGNYSRKAQIIADSYFPKVEELAKKYFYAMFLSGNVMLFKVPRNRHQHKEPYMKFGDLTGVLTWHNKEKIPASTGGQGGSKVSKTDQMTLFSTMKLLRNPKEGKPLSWKDIGKKLGEMQDKAELNYTSDLKEKSNDWLSATFTKLKKKYDV